MYAYIESSKTLKIRKSYDEKAVVKIENNS